VVAKIKSTTIVAALLLCAIVADTDDDCHTHDDIVDGENNHARHRH